MLCPLYACFDVAGRPGGWADTGRTRAAAITLTRTRSLHKEKKGGEREIGGLSKCREPPKQSFKKNEISEGVVDLSSFHHPRFYSWIHMIALSTTERIRRHELKIVILVKRVRRGVVIRMSGDRRLQHENAREQRGRLIFHPLHFYSFRSCNAFHF